MLNCSSTPLQSTTNVGCSINRDHVWYEGDVVIENVSGQLVINLANDSVRNLPPGLGLP